VQLLPDNHGVWWPLVTEDKVYCAVQRRIPEFPDTESVTPGASEDTFAIYGRELCFVNHVDRQAELWSSGDGSSWRRVAVISDRDQSSETALTSLDDGRLVAFLRHDDHSSPPQVRDRPEILVSEPPYTDWFAACRLGFRSNGPSIGNVDGTVVTCSRAFFEDPRTPLSSDLCRARVRGLILGIFDPGEARWEPALALPHHSAQGPGLGFPDVSYAWILDRGGGDFALAYYEGFKEGPSGIHLARLIL
jgi:hypothetical protein